MNRLRPPTGVVSGVSARHLRAWLAGARPCAPTTMF